MDSNNKSPLEVLKNDFMKDQETEISEAIAIESRQTAGPIPSADELEKYNNIEKGFADRIIKMAELEQTQRHKCEDIDIKNKNILYKKLIHSERMKIHLGYLFGFVITAGMIYATYSLIINNHETTGTLFGGAGFILIIVMAYIKPKNSSNDDDHEKDTTKSTQVSKNQPINHLNHFNSAKKVNTQKKIRK